MLQNRSLALAMVVLVISLSVGIYFSLFHSNKPTIAPEIDLAVAPKEAAPADTSVVAEKNSVKADTSDSEQEKVPEDSRSLRYQAITSNPAYPTLESRLDALATRYPDKSFDADELLDLLAEPNAWRNTTEATSSIPLTDEQRNDGREFIEFDSRRLEILLPGDTIDLPVTTLGTHLKMKVDSIESLPNGGSTWNGQIEGFNEPLHATITQANGLSLGGFETPEGHYSFQANGDNGWVASSAILFKQHHHETDAIIPPDE